MTTTYKPYPAYKDSGVEWLGEIPEGWEVNPLFSATKVESIKNSDGKETNVLSLSYGRIIRRDVEKNYGLLPASFNTYQLVNEGDIILRLTDLQNDKRSLRVGRATEQGIITSAYLKLTSKNRLNDKYLYRLLHSYDTTKVYYGMGGGLRQSMKFEDMRRLPLLIPSLSEQTQIANFLDHETARIDTLIAKQKKLIALLKEKRQAVISHAVTKGLNPDVEMKDSGVEWFHTLPKHWTVTKLGYCATISNGATPSRENQYFWEGGTIGWLNSSKVNDVIINSAEQFITDLAMNKTGVQPVNANDLLIAITGEGQTRGRVAISKIDATINQHLACISIKNQEINYQYLFYWLQCQYKRIRYESSGAGSTKGAITCADIKQYSIPLPPLKEQASIVSYILKIDKKLHDLILLANDQINLLQERRTALISAAVTGKIDLRDWQAPQEQSAKVLVGQEA